MFNRDGVIRFAAEVVANHGEGVGAALSSYLASSGRGEAEVLRGHLVALSAGFESTAHDGSTYAARVQAAKNALEAWDGPKLEQAVYASMQIRAARVVWASVWGATIYTDGTVGHLPHGFEELLALGVEVTGSRSDGAVLWALAEQQRRREAKGSVESGTALAAALDHIATELGSESARSLVDRMPDRLRNYVREVWVRGR
jgi:hypothetical protein